jgi:hypothetical protein
MRLRDTAIVAAVLLVAGFAAADALRGDAEPTAGTAEPTETSPPETEPSTTLAGVPPGTLSGRLVFTDRG